MSKINGLIEFLKGNKNKITSKELKSKLRKINLKSEDLMPWVDFDHPKNEGYGRKMVYEDSNFEVMIMSWMPNDFSAVHNHGYTQWGAVQVFGNATQYIYKVQNNSISLVEKQILDNEKIVIVTNDFIHQMGNQSEDSFLTLHIYGAKTPHKVVTADALIYEIEKQRIVKTSGGVFFQLNEDKVKFVSDLNCNDENTIEEFKITILPKSKYFTCDQQKQIQDWIDHKKPSILK